MNDQDWMTARYKADRASFRHLAASNLVAAREYKRRGLNQTAFWCEGRASAFKMAARSFENYLRDFG